MWECQIILDEAALSKAPIAHTWLWFSFIHWKEFYFTLQISIFHYCLKTSGAIVWVSQFQNSLLWWKSQGWWKYYPTSAVERLAMELGCLWNSGVWTQILIKRLPDSAHTLMASRKFSGSYSSSPACALPDLIVHLNASFTPKFHWIHMQMSFQVTFLNLKSVRLP